MEKIKETGKRVEWLIKLIRLIRLIIFTTEGTENTEICAHRRDNLGDEREHQKKQLLNWHAL